MSSSKSLFINTIYLYIRMLFIMFLSLYTTRIVLKELGLVDFGIYDVVAGVITSLGFVNQSLASANQRFLAFAIGEKKNDRLNGIYSTSLTIFIIIATIALLVGETVGLWFVKTKLTIPEERVNAAIIVYQLSLFSFIISMLTIPYIAEIIAHEKMKIYAVIGILDYSLKLIIAFLLSIGGFDKLITFGVLNLVATLIVFLLYFTICKKMFSECKYKTPRDKELFKEMIFYSGWTTLGSVAGVANNQGNTILINVFFTPIVNTARAVSLQVIGAISSFANNFFTAVRPAIIKSYADGDMNYTMKLFYSSAKLSYYLMFLICFPIFLEMDFVLNIWLNEVNEQMVLFTRLALIYAFILALNNPITTLIQATGKVRNYFLFVESFTLLSLPLTYLCFKQGFNPEATFIVSIVVFSFAHIMRLIILSQNVSAFKIKDYLTKFFLTAFFLSLVSSFIPIYIESIYQDRIQRFFFVFISFILIFSTLVFLFGLNTDERNKVKHLLSNLKKQFVK